ncbi:unnamed protein product [Clavelina lepadiformis]|uniref:Uncharacterized protein n=1 Tax=Clavelina lepadiformis TaxID=159417 RepID=A0ABP0F7S9_CLALP
MICFYLPRCIQYYPGFIGYNFSDKWLFAFNEMFIAFLSTCRVFVNFGTFRPGGIDFKVTIVKRRKSSLRICNKKFTPPPETLSRIDVKHLIITAFFTFWGLIAFLSTCRVFVNFGTFRPGGIDFKVTIVKRRKSSLRICNKAFFFLFIITSCIQIVF